MEMYHHVSVYSISLYLSHAEQQWQFFLLALLYVLSEEERS